MAVPLASAFVRLRPDANENEFRKTGRRMGDAAGDEVGKGVTKGTTAGVKGSAPVLGKAGQAAGSSYADGFYRDASGKLRQANGRFATDAQKRMIEGGVASGRGFGQSFTREGGGIITRGFGKLKNELGPLLVPLGVGAAVAAIGSIGMEYEDNLNIFKSVTKATGDQMAIVAEKARALGADVQLPGVSAAGAAAAMTELSKAGFTVQEAMDAARGTLQLARVANLSEADAAEIAANAVNAFGINARDTMFVVDELAAAANSSSIEISDASLSFKMAAAVFSGVQAPAVGSKEAITELNTAIAILGNNGIKGSDAGTSLKQMLLQLTGPTQQAKGQMQLLAARAQGATISLEQQNDVLHGSKAIRDKALAAIMKMNPALKEGGDIAYDASGKMRSLRDILELTAKGTAGMTQEEKNYAITQIFGADASRSVIALLKGGLPVYDKQRKAILAQGAAADFAAAKNAGLRGAIDNVKGQLENAAIAIYNAVKGPLTTGLNGLANILAPLAGHVATFAKFVSDNIGTIRDWAVAIGAVTLALKINSAMLAVNAAGGILQYIKGVRIVTGATRIWAATQTILNASLLANPIGIVIIALTALVAGVILAYRHSETFRNIVQGAWHGIQVAATATARWFMTYIWPALKAAWDGIAAGALWLWHNVIEPVWHGIQVAVSKAVSIVKILIAAAILEFRAIAAVATWLWRNIFAPVFAGIGAIVSTWWSAVKVVFGAVKAFFENVIFPVFRFLYDYVVRPVFAAISKSIEIAWFAIRIIFAAWKNYMQNTLGAALSWLWNHVSDIFRFIGKMIATWWQGVKIIFTNVKNAFLAVGRFFRWVYDNTIAPMFIALGAFIARWWNNTVKPVFNALKTAWDVVSSTFSRIYRDKIKPVFDAFVKLIKTNVVGGFNQGVSAIGKAWDKVKEVARKPVAFVVNTVINPFIRGLNKAAKVVGVKDQVSEIKGFHDGGQVLAKPVGYFSGGRIAGTPGLTDNRQAMVSGLGPVQLNGGEFVVNAKDTRKALPLLNWVNRGMSGGVTAATRYLGRRPTREPGDGSEGWAFKDGGLIGWVKDVWGAVTNPAETIRKPFEAALNRIPGVGMIKDFLIGSAKKLLGGAVSWLTGIGGGGAGGRVGAAQNFVRAQAGKPYVWASAGPHGYDCSGIVSAAFNVLKGRSPYSHTFSTGGLPGPWFTPGKLNSPLIAGWSHPGQRPASASVGHMAGQIGGLPFESRGSRGVVVGAQARRVRDFANVGGARLHSGGQVTPQLFDGGGPWRTGVLGLNASGHTEHVMTGGPGGDMERMLELLAAQNEILMGLGVDIVEAQRVGAKRTARIARGQGPQGVTGGRL